MKHNSVKNSLFSPCCFTDGYEAEFHLERMTISCFSPWMEIVNRYQLYESKYTVKKWHAAFLTKVSVHLNEI